MPNQTGPKSIEAKPHSKHRDPRYASARPWDWRLCQDCQSLISCGGAHLSQQPRDIIEAAICQHGFPPGRP